LLSISDNLEEVCELTEILHPLPIPSMSSIAIAAVVAAPAIASVVVGITIPAMLLAVVAAIPGISIVIELIDILTRLLKTSL